MQRRCIICGQEPFGHYLYPRNMNEAQKWQSWGNMHDFNVPAATLRKYGCVCGIHLEKEKLEQRIVGGMPSEAESNQDKRSSYISTQEQQQQQRSAKSTNERYPEQREDISSANSSELYWEQYHGRSSANSSQPKRKMTPQESNVCTPRTCPARTHLIHPPKSRWQDKATIQPPATDTSVTNKSFGWTSESSKQFSESFKSARSCGCTGKQEKPGSMTTRSESSSKSTRYPQKKKQQQTQWCQCSLPLAGQDQQIQFPSQVPPRGRTSSGHQASAAPAKATDNSSSRSDHSNAVNVLIMGTYGQKADKYEEQCSPLPTSFQSSPVTEICLLESDLTGGNERAVFPDIDELNYTVCRASTAEETNAQTNENYENCTDVLVLSKGLTGGPCPCKCEDCLLTDANGKPVDMNQLNCPRNGRQRQKQKSGQDGTAKTQQQLQEKREDLLKGNLFDPQAAADYNQVLEEQKARVSELEELLAQHHQLQKTIQSKVDELKCKAEKGQENEMK